MNASDQFENELLKLIFNNEAIPLVGDAAGILGSAISGELYLSLHEDDPGEDGNQTTNEATYSGYMRVPVARLDTVWDVVDNVATLLSVPLAFPVANSGGITITHFGIGVVQNGAGKLLFSAELATPIEIPTITPFTPELSVVTVTFD
jgi:hypothetical protein